MKKIIYLLIFFCINTLFAQNKYDAFWKELLSNDREAASDVFKKIKNDDSVIHLVINEVLREESGLFKSNPDFIPSFLNEEDFQYYLYALWNKNYVFTPYLDTGFNDKIKAKIKTIQQSNLSNTTIKDAITYLDGVAERDNNNWEAYTNAMKSIQAFKNWQYCGVFENLNKSGLDRVYEPETRALSKESFNAESNGYVNWYTAKNQNEAYQFFTNHEEYGQGVNYAQSFITASKEEEVILRIGCGSAFKLWLNDVLVYENTQDVTTEMNAYQVKVKIPKGENRLLIKTAESGYGSYFIISALNLDGSHNSNLKDSSEYRDYNKSTLSQINPQIIENEFEEFFKNKIKENPDDFFYAFCLTSAYFRNSKYEEAKLLLEPYLKKYPKSSLIRKLLIGAYNLEADYTSVKELNKNIELDDPNYYYPILLKVINFDELTRMTLDELDEFLKVLKKSIDYELMHITADFIYNARKEDKAKVKKNIDELIKNSDNNIQLKLRYAPLYASLFEEDDKTIALLEDMNKNHFDYGTIVKLASFYDRKGEKEKSLNTIKEDLEYLGDDNYYLKSIVYKLHNYQKFEESLPYIEKGIENFPYSFSLYEYKGDALLQISKKAEAIAAYEESLKHNSANKSLRKKLKDLNNKTNLLKELVEEEAYDYIQDSRGKITGNNYGFNILMDNCAVELYSEGGGNYRFIYIYEITSDSGVERFKEYNLGLSGNYNVIKSEIVKKDKSIVPADKSGSSFVFNGLSVGDVIYIDYENTFSNTGRFYDSYTDRFMLGSFHPAVESSLKIIAPKGHKINYKTLNGNLEPKISNKGNSTLYEWSIKNNPGLSHGEDYMPTDADIAEYVHISTIKDWNEISSWYSDLVRSRMEFDSTVEKVFNELFPNGHKQLSEDERAKIIYNYIRENFTYSYVSFRQSGFVPQKPSKTIKTGLGDCKDFSTLFVTLAQKAELKSNLVLILTSDYGKNNLVLPSKDFNHCIAKVMIDGKEQFLELTDKYLPYKSLPTSLRGATGLEIPTEYNQGSIYDLFKLDDVSRDLAVSKNKVKLIVSPENIKMDIEVEYTGHINSYYSSVFSEPNFEVVKKSIYDDFNSKLSDEFTLDALTNVDRIDNDKIIKYSANLTIDKKASKIGKTSILQIPIISNPYTSQIISLEKRNYEIDYIQYENVDQYQTTYDIFIRDNQKFTEIPENIDLSFKSHTYKMNFELVKDNHLRVSIEANPDLERIAPEDYPEFKAYVKQILEAEQAFIGYKDI